MSMRGAKKGAGRAPVEEKDSLRSTQFAEVLDLVSEGEIQGLVQGLQSVFLDQVAVENSDGTRNFEGVGFAYTTGTQGQAALPGYPGVQTEVPVAVLVTQAVPVVRTITNAAVDTVRVTVSFPQLSFQDPEKGDMKGTTVEYAIDVQSSGGGYVEKYRSEVTGKSMTKYMRAARIPLTGAAPWNIRVRRITAPAASSNIQDTLHFESFTEIQTLKLRYPNSAIHALRVSAQQFSRVPVRAYDVLGIRCQVPVNYDPITRVYTGVWNGTFKIAWTNNPAWITYDLATNTRYGLGKFVTPAMVDKWGLYQIGQYCDATVSDGYGGTEPRFTYNGVLQTRAEAYRVMQDLAAVFRGMVFYANSQVQFTQDAPSDPEVLYSNGNVKDGRFVYAGFSAKQKHSVAIVYWNNPREFFKRVPEVVSDPELVTRYGLREMEIQPLGITSRGQAARVGLWQLYSEQNETETITFIADLAGAGARLGKVFKVSDSAEAGERLGGRIVAATTGQVTLDAPVTLDVGVAYTLTVMLPDATAKLRYKTEERSVTTGAGTVSVLNVSPAFSVAPQPQTMWVLSSGAVEATLWRYVSIKELSPTEYEIVGVAHNPAKYAAIESGVQLEARSISRLRITPIKPVGLVLNEVLYRDDATYKSRVTAAWTTTSGKSSGLRFQVSWRYASGAWTELTETPDRTIDISGLDPGLVEVSVRTVNALGNQSVPLEASITVQGKLAPPANVSGFSLAFTATGIQATWAECPDVDWTATEISRSIDFIPSQQVTLKRSTTHLMGWLLSGTHVFYAAHWDHARRSVVAATAQIKVISPKALIFRRAEVQELSVMLSWTDVLASQPIKRFLYRVGGASDTWATATEFGGAGGDQRSDVLRFSTPGLKRIFVAAEDVGGNLGTPNSVDVTTTLPPGFLLTDQFTSVFAGTKTNAQINSDGALLMMAPAETWNTHFSTRGYANTAAQVTAGFPLYFQPGTLSAQYVEEFDLARVVVSSTISFTGQYAWLNGGGTVTPKVSYRLTAVSAWIDVPNAWAAVGTNFRYFRITIDVAGTSQDDLLQVTALQATISTSQLLEYATVTSIAGDAAGTAYVTTKGFIDVTAAVFSPNSDTVARHSVIPDDSVSPAVVRVKCWDAAGTRITASGSLVIAGVGG